MRRGAGALMQIISRCAVLVFGLGTPGAAQEAMTFERAANGGNCFGCLWTAAEGVITKETPDAFRAYLEDGLGRVIMFNSPGGDLGAALELGRLIREAGGATAVGATVHRDPSSSIRYELHPGSCESACAFAFMGGTSRVVVGDDLRSEYPPGKLGVHRFFRRQGQDIPSAATQAIMGQLLFYMLDMGVDTEVLAKASRVPEDEMYFFTDDELVDLSIQTSVYQTPIELMPRAGGLVLAWEFGGGPDEPYTLGVISCVAETGDWILDVTHPRAPNKDLGFAREDGAWVVVGNGEIRLEPRDIGQVLRVGGGSMLRLRLPVDLPAFGGVRLRFNPSRTTATRGFWHIEGRLPEASKIAVLQRACVL